MPTVIPPLGLVKKPMNQAIQTNQFKQLIQSTTQPRIKTRVQDRSKIDYKSIKNRSKIDQKSIPEGLGAQDGPMNSRPQVSSSKKYVKFEKIEPGSLF